FALTDPFFDGEVREARRLILVVDNSGSMRATDVSPSRLDAALQDLRQVVAKLDEVGGVETEVAG
ncbi:VWA domain-containing protein, partial [bacterium]|nr:VWA domain-containing protein [bacterium]